MRTSIQLVEEVRKILEIATGEAISNYRISKELGISRQMVSQVFNYGKHLPEQSVIGMSKILNEPQEALLAELNAERAKRTDVREIWERVARQLMHTAAAIMLVVGLVTASDDVEAADSTVSVCILCKIKDLLILILKLTAFIPLYNALHH